MGSIKKLLISLLVGMVVTGAFLVAGFTGFFDRFETTFYNARVLESVDSELQRVNSVFQEYQSEIINEGQNLVTQPAFQNSFNLNQSSQDINVREDLLDEFTSGFPALRSLRIVDDQLVNLEYSSRFSDIEFRGTSGIRYFPVEDLDFPFDLEGTVQDLASEDRGSWIRRISEEFQLFIYLIPVYNNFDIFSGYALFEFDTSSLTNILTREQLIPFGGEIRIFPPDGLIINPPQRAEGVVGSLTERWDALKNSEALTLSIDGQGEVLVRILGDQQSSSVFLVPLSELELSTGMIIFLNLLLFFTAFLLIFLLLNIRQDSEVVIRDRVKRFQLDLLQEAVDQRGNIDVAKWQSELRSRKDDIKKRITSGITKRDRQLYDELIDSSWDDILDILGSRRMTNQISNVNFDARYLEQLVENIAARLEHTGLNPNAIPAGLPVPQKKQGNQEPAELEDELSEVEEIEEIEEIEEAGAVEELGDIAAGEDLGEPVEVEEVSELDEAEELSEVEEIDEIEEIEEAGAVEELGDIAAGEDLGEPVEVEEVSELDEAEELSEVEEIEEIDEIEEAGDVEELGDIAAGEDLGEPVEVEEVSEIEEADELSEVGEIEEFEEIEEAGAVEELGEIAANEDLGEPVEVEEVSEHDEADELSEVEEIEEIEEIEEVGSVEELGDIAAGEGLGEPVEVEEVSEHDEADELSEVEEIEEIEEIEEAGDVEELGEIAAGEDLGEPVALAIQPDGIEELDEDLTEILGSPERPEFDKRVGENGADFKTDSIMEDDSEEVSDFDSIVNKDSTGDGYVDDLDIEQAIRDIDLELPDIAEFDLDMQPGDALEAMDQLQDDIENPAKEIIPVRSEVFSGISALSSGGYRFMGSSMDYSIVALEAPTEQDESDDDALEVLEVLDDLDELSDLDDLSDLRPADDNQVGVLGYSDGGDDEPIELLDELESQDDLSEERPDAFEQDYIRISIPELMEEIGRRFSRSDVISESEGIPKINDSVYHTGSSTKDPELQNLLGEISEQKTKPEESPEDIQGIHDIFAGEDLDLDDILGTAETNKDSKSQGDSRQFYGESGSFAKIKLGSQGLLYGQYQASFPHKSNRSLKAMMRLSREVDAISIALVRSEAGTLSLDGSIGFSEDDFSSWGDSDKELFDDIIRNNQLEYFRSEQLGRRLPVFITLSDRINSAIVLPVVVADQRSALFLGLHGLVGDVAQFCAEHFELGH